VLAGPARCDAALAALALCAPDAPRQRGGQP